MSIVEKALKKQSLGAETASFAESPQASNPSPTLSSIKASGGGGLLGTYQRFFPEAGRFDVAPAALVGCGLAPHSKHEARQLAQFRSIRKSICDGLRASERVGQPAKRIISITSAFAAEGKTYTAFNVARSLARDGEYQVLLVDGDLAKRRLTTALGLMNADGLAEALLPGGAGLASLSVAFGDSDLAILPAGRAYASASERLASGELERQLGELVDRYPKLVVIIDSGPILLATEAEALVSASDAVVFVVRSGVTSRNAVRDAISRIGDARPVSFVLNAWESSGFGEQESYYGEYYGDVGG